MAMISLGLLLRHVDFDHEGQPEICGYQPLSKLVVQMEMVACLTPHLKLAGLKAPPDTAFLICQSFELHLVSFPGLALRASVLDGTRNSLNQGDMTKVPLFQPKMRNKQ